MHVGSRMAALVLLAGSTGFLFVEAMAQKSGPQDKGPGTATLAPPDHKPAEKPAAPADARTVELTLMIAGLGRNGCEVEVKPGSRACRFKPQSVHVSTQGKASFSFRDVEVRGADRNCTFSITLREQGQPPKTVYRGFRIPARPDSGAGADAKKAPASSFTCYVNCPSKVAGLEKPDTIRR